MTPPTHKPLMHTCSFQTLTVYQKDARRDFPVKPNTNYISLPPLCSSERLQQKRSIQALLRSSPLALHLSVHNAAQTRGAAAASHQQVTTKRTLSDGETREREEYSRFN
ncbi:hypothetical protein C0J45_9833 [Silurus meridionalis]|nr:hypothetical protein C0J45_9833 [Silurus meridionalis]